MTKRAKSIENLIRELNKLPGIGRKTAQRLAYYIIDLDKVEVKTLAESIVAAKENVKRCKICDNLTDSDICEICSNNKRDESLICVVEYPKDVEAMERANCYKGLYHVLHGVISPIRGLNADDISLRKLLQRLSTNKVEEVIIATGPNVDGETTAIYISNILSKLGVKVSRIAYGLPVGGDLEYYDELTISTAMENRTVMGEK
ncbi:recombination mediator RecR [Peptoniphilus catoniae]|uniref:recombination mediator RecR n=1 Tax=Peptoniphilus catoniae TaxID=1660341 RepID=UPI0010FD2B02|nr:recombination mediator RecR [Peptoniphilus catoniae]